MEAEDLSLLPFVADRFVICRAKEGKSMTDRWEENEGL